MTSMTTSLPPLEDILHLIVDTYVLRASKLFSSPEFSAEFNAEFSAADKAADLLEVLSDQIELAEINSEADLEKLFEELDELFTLFTTPR